MRLATAVLAVAVLLPGHALAAPESSVRIRNNAFDPVEIRVPQGARLTWTLAEGRHTVTSDVRGHFDSGAMEKAGQRFELVAPRRDVTLFYHCKIHGIGGSGDRWGSGMVGRVVVGTGSPEPRTASDVEVRSVPSPRWPSISRALDGLQADKRYRVDLRPGIYRPHDITPASVGIRGRPKQHFELVIRGRGSRPTDVVFDGGETGLSLSLDGIQIENLSFRRQSFASVFVQGVDRWGVDDVVVSKAGRYGIWIDEARHGRVRRVSIVGAGVAGISARTCGECDLVVDSVTVRQSLQGFSGRGAGTFVIRGSTFQDNGVGVALRGAALLPKSLSTGDLAHRGSHVFLNTFKNNQRQVAQSPRDAADNLAVGAGVWIEGGAFDVVEQNEFDGHSFGVVLTGPSFSSRVSRNALSRSREADIAWDGLGEGVCFSANVQLNGDAATAMPPLAQEIYSCDLPTTAGVPYPLVTATLLGGGLAGRDAAS
jgi:plastocyanin